jgi:hypothetical protein
MRPILALAVAASALAMGAPAAAQWYPPAYGFAGNYGYVRSLQARIDQLQYQIRRLDRFNAISEREARRLREQSREIERRLRYSARHGLHPNEAYAIQRRIAILEQRIAYAANYGNRYYRYAGNRHWNDRRRDRDDRRYYRSGRDRDDDDDDD